MGLKDRLADPRFPDRRPRRAAYALPTLFTAGNIFLGYLSMLRSFKGAMLAASGDPRAHEHFTIAATALVAAGFLDGLDGRIARMTNTTSEFGREMDSLADVISFGMAPAVLAFAWGVQFVEPSLGEPIRNQLHNAGYFIAFLFLMCGAARLARFNIQKNPIPKNPGRPDRKYFVGLPIPAAAGMVCTVVFAADGEPLTWWPLSVAWLALLLLLGFLMVCTWRYYSFKGINLNKPYTPLIVILVAGLIYATWNWPQPVLLVLAITYVSSGILVRAGGILRRRLKPLPLPHLQRSKELAEHSTVALIGSESLLGREIRDILATSAPGIDLRLIASDDEQAGTLARVGDEPSLVEILGPESLDGARAVFLAGSAESNRKALEMAVEIPGVIIIDLLYSSEDRPDARVRAPLLESEPEPDEESLEAGIHVVAHPAAIALAMFLRRLHSQDPIRRSVIQILAPASEYGTAAVEELQQQTVSLLSFKGMPRAIFGTQLTFNLLAKYGDDAPIVLEETELRIERHLATLLALPGDGEAAPMPSLRLSQAPVFHGYTFSAWVEFEGNPGVEVLEGSLGTTAIEVRGRDFEPPTNVGQAGQSGIAVGNIAEDRNNPDACWFWFVADNLRLSAENAVAVARELV